jgi:hypothetical protein
MEEYPLNMFNEQVRRAANLRAYEKPLEAIEHQLKMRSHRDYFRLVMAAVDLYLTYAPFDMPNEPERAGMEISGEFIAR